MSAAAQPEPSTPTTRRARSGSGSAFVIVWGWVVLSLAVAIPFFVVAGRLPERIWLVLIGRVLSSSIDVPTSSVVVGAAIIVAVELALAVGLTVAALARARGDRSAQPRSRGALWWILLVVAVVTVVGSFVGAEAIVCSIPPQVDHSALTSSQAASRLGAFSSPVAIVANGILVVALVGSWATGLIRSLLSARRSQAARRARGR